MRRQLSPEQSSHIASSLALDPNDDLSGALKEALTGITEIFPAFTMRDFSSVWNLKHPGFTWDKNKNKVLYETMKPLPTKGFWELSFLIEESPKAETLPLVDAQEENLTRPWMQEAFKKDLHKKVTANIKKKFPQESWEEILSEVSALMMEWGEKGLCDRYIKKGNPPTVAILSVWAAQKIRQRVYGDAMDSLQREYRGLRTQTEMRKRREKNMEDFILEEGMKSDPNAPKTVWILREDNTSEMVVVSPEEEQEVLPEELEKKLSMVRNYIRVKRKRSPDRYARVFDFLKKGTPKREAAVIEGCSELTISHLYQKVREDLKEAPKVLGIAFLLMKKIAEEPFSTLDEIREENSGFEIEDISNAIGVLLLGDLISEAKGNSYFPTEAGKVLSSEA